MDVLASIMLIMCTATPAQFTQTADQAPSAAARLLVAQGGTGCCKRFDRRMRTWRRIDASRDKCEELNTRHDGDNILERNGAFWWDSQCSG